MKEFGDQLLALRLGIIRALHLEGGPEASLTVHGPGVDIDRNGCAGANSRETAAALERGNRTIRNQGEVAGAAL